MWTSSLLRRMLSYFKENEKRSQTALCFSCSVVVEEVGEDYDGSRHQLVSATIDDTHNVDPTLTLDPVTFPYGYCILHEANLVSDEHQEIHKLQTAEFRAVRENCYRVLQGLLAHPDNQHLLNDESRRFVAMGMEELLRAKLNGKLGEEIFMIMLDRLSPADGESIMSEIMAKTDLSTAVEKHTFLSNQLSIIDFRARSLVKHFFVANDTRGYALRAGVPGVIDGALFGLACVKGPLWLGPLGANISNVLVFVFLCGMEVYRWCDKENNISTSTMVANVGEHAMGCGAGMFGGAAGSALGFIVCPFLGGALIGGILGGFLADYVARASYRGTANYVSKQMAMVNKKALVEEAAAIFGIELVDDSYMEAKKKYRLHILPNHPDRCPVNASEGERAFWNARAANYIAQWNIVRRYYSENKLIAHGTYDAFSILQVLQTYDKVMKVWNSMRSWLNDQAAFPVGLQGPETRVVEYKMYY